MYLIQSHKEDKMILAEIKLGILGLIIIRWSDHTWPWTDLLSPNLRSQSTSD